MALPEGEWRARHRLMVLIVAAHVPFLLGYGLLSGVVPLTVALSVSVIAVLCGLAILPGGRVRRSLAATAGLLTCSAALVALSHGAPEAHFHFFLAVILVALYQDWRALAGAFAYVVVEHSVIAAVSYHSVYGQGQDSLRDIALLTVAHGGYILAAGACLMVFWSYSERAHRREEGYRQQLLDAEMGALARIREAGQMREDLIASVSHEFRTPLTAIRGAAATLRDRGDKVRPEARQMLLSGICEHGERLTKLLEDMLAAASVSVSDPRAVSDVSAAAEAVRQQPGLTVVAAPGLAAYIDARSLTQLVQALAGHGLEQARPGRPAQLLADQDGRHALLQLSYRTAGGQREDAARLLEPFGSHESATTGRRTSLGAYVARRITEVNGGTAEAHVEGDLVRIELRLRLLRPREDRAPAARGDAAPGGIDAGPDSAEHRHSADREAATGSATVELDDAVRTSQGAPR
jgi:signal transduction histidine kinase